MVCISNTISCRPHWIVSELAWFLAQTYWDLFLSHDDVTAGLIVGNEGIGGELFAYIVR